MMDVNEVTRVRQGACETTSPDILYQLACDPSVTVRASLALNPALPDEVTAILKADTDIRVRTILSRRLAALTPALADETRQQVQKDAVAALTAMVAEAALRVRGSISEAVRDMPDGPREIILRLAHDPAIMVCEPVILFSPMLTQEDLVVLIASGPPPTTVQAVANRPRIGTAVSDAIVGSADPAAICALLRNHTAQIREATLDALAAQSEEQTDWQEPLVRRPHLPVRAQRMLAEIVTGHLLDVLAARDDLDPKVGTMLRSALECSTQDRFDPSRDRPGSADLNTTTALTRAQALLQSGQLDDRAILDALRRNADLEASAMLAVKGGGDGAGDRSGLWPAKRQGRRQSGMEGWVFRPDGSDITDDAGPTGAWRSAAPRTRCPLPADGGRNALATRVSRRRRRRNANLDAAAAFLKSSAPRSDLARDRDPRRDPP
jgi:uncharacterized protein (DUF2336 family)